MKSIFSTYLELGFSHISDINAYDHILFLVALCAIYSLKEWKKILVLVTAFTIGHSITLALAALKLFFGLIHGMGFSNFLRSMLMPGQEEELIPQLLAFNIGVELGQLLIVAIILACSFVALHLFKAKQREWTLFVSGAAAGVALILMMDTYPF